MRNLQLLLLAIACLSLFGACVEPLEDAPEEVVTEVESTIEAQPMCPDLVFRLRYTEECTTPRGEGTRECTDTITMHRSPVFKVTGVECKTTDTTVTTSCGFCIVIELPDDEPGEIELPL